MATGQSEEEKRCRGLRHMKNDKGLKGGKCNRTACLNRPAECFSTYENAYYCVPCARKINEYLPAGVAPIQMPAKSELTSRQ
jgi:hypothetical protein